MKKLFLFATLLIAFNSYAQNYEEGDGPIVRYQSGVNKELPVCTKWESRQECNMRRVCRIVCSGAGGAAGAALGGGIGAGAGIGAGTQICNEVCEMVPDCRTVQVCVQWYNR
jgi:hypothetical protein